MENVREHGLVLFVCLFVLFVCFLNRVRKAWGVGGGMHGYEFVCSLIPAGAAEEFSFPELTCAVSYSVSVPPP